jgi:hypothetical protein
MAEPGQDVNIEGPVATAGAQSLPAEAMPPPPAQKIEVKLGKQPAKSDPRDLMYAAYRRPRGLAVGASAHWGHDLPYDILGNGQYGDCVEAGAHHALQVVWDRSTNSTAAYVPTVDATLGDYSAITGFSTDNPDSDQGTNMRQACGFWRSTGLNSGQHKIAAYLAVTPDNDVHAKEAVQYYGGLYVGIAMPASAEAQTFVTEWSVGHGPDAKPGSWGGHCVIITGYDPEGLWCVTWGRMQKMSWDFYGTYCDEAYVLLFEQWVKSDGYAPSGLSWGQLMTDLNTLS